MSARVIYVYEVGHSCQSSPVVLTLISTLKSVESNEIDLHEGELIHDIEQSDER